MSTTGVELERRDRERGGSAAADGSAGAAGPGPTDPEGHHRRDPIRDAVHLVAWLSITAGAIHAIATVDHFSHYWLYGAVFLVLTYGQVLWGFAVLRGRVQQRGLVAGALANLAILAAWAFTRAIVVPFGPDAGSPEPVGAIDVAVALDELVLIAYVVAIVRPDLRARRVVRGLLGPHRVRLGVALCSVTFFAAMLGGHTH